MFAAKALGGVSLGVVLLGASVIGHADPGTGTFEIGAGYSSDENFIAHARVEQSSLFGTGHMLALDARISAIRQRFTLDYMTPATDALGLAAQVHADDRQLPAFRRRGIGAGLTLSQRFGEHVRAYAGLAAERVSVDEGPAFTLVTVRTGLEYVDASTRIGMRYDISDRRLGSAYGFDRMTVYASHDHPIGPLTLHLSGAATTLLGDVPVSERLFFEGASDLRGYSPGALAPLGGTQKIIGRAELEVPIVRRIGLSMIGFLDAGAIADAQHLATGQDAGVGLLWRSPIGPVRVDLAQPFDGGPPRLSFSFGGSF